MAQQQKKIVQRSEEEVNQLYAEMMKKMQSSSQLAQQIMQIDGISGEAPDDLEKMEFQDWELSQVGLPDGLFSFNDPGVVARKIYILKEMAEMEPRLQKVVQELEDRKIRKQEEMIFRQEEIDKMKEEMAKISGSPPSKIRKIVKIGGVLAFGAAFTQMPSQMRLGVAAAGAAGLAFKISDDIEEIKQMKKKEMFQAELHMKKLRQMQGTDEALALEFLREIKDLKILTGQMCTKICSMEFGMTYPAGNQIRSFMKIVEKLGYAEVRLMLLTLDSNEAARRLHQELETSTDFKMAKEGGKKIAEEFISARLRFRDVPKVSMAKIKKDWEEIVSKVATRTLADCQKQIDEMTKNEKTTAQQIKGWQDWKEILQQFKKIDWHSEIERFQIVESTEIPASSKMASSSK